jgi:hypothetical protein
MESKETITVEYSPEHLPALIKFCKACEEPGYKNNTSIEAMKLDWCLAVGGQFFLTYFKNKLVSVSGCHPLPEVDDRTYRLMFRGVALPEYQNFSNVVSKTMLNSATFYYHVPRQINWAKIQGYDSFVITTNSDNPEIKSMNKSHRALRALSYQGLVDCIAENMTLFYTEQSVWKLNVGKFNQIREEFRIRHNLDE